ncbi:BnaA01g05460D [Brassica napus]|uniref:BnaA01g05460D protein n=1 Tax=Brassica napus TaxID=3708 RepID=A0A078HX69_BRANA|nr:BnaA01g05460D [Brassica napus]
MEVIDFSETEMEAAEQLVQLSEDDTLSCSSGTGLSFSGCEGGFHRKRHNDVISDEVQNDGVSQQLNKDKIETIYYHALFPPRNSCEYGIPQPD